MVSIYLTISKSGYAMPYRDKHPKKWRNRLKTIFKLYTPRPLSVKRKKNGKRTNLKRRTYSSLVKREIIRFQHDIRVSFEKAKSIYQVWWIFKLYAITQRIRIKIAELTSVITPKITKPRWQFFTIAILFY